MENPSLYPPSNKTETMIREIINRPTMANFPLEWCSCYARTVANTAEEVTEILGLNIPIIYSMPDGFGKSSFRAAYDGPCEINLYPRDAIRYWYIDESYRIPDFKYGETSTRESVSHELFHAWVWEYDRERYLRDIYLIAQYGHRSQFLMAQEKCARTFSQLYAQAHLETGVLGKIGFKATTWLENWLFDGMSDQYRKNHPEMANHQ